MERDVQTDEEATVAKLKQHKCMVQAVTITGGEPTLHADLPQFMTRLKREGFLIKLDTNGITPTMIREIINLKLADYFAMDLKQRWEKYDEIIRIHAPAIVNRCRETFSLIQQSGVPHEFRTTILPSSHTIDDFMTMAGYLKPQEKYFIQETRFEHTLMPDLERVTKFSIGELLWKIQAAYPHLFIEKR